MTAERVDLVCVDRKRSSRNWDIANSEQRVIEIHNASLLDAAFRNGINELGKDIRRVIFDQATDSSSFLQFLSALPVDFRGDVILIREDGSAFLSAPAARGDGRVLYGLTAEDLDFYLAATYTVRSSDPVVTESNFFEIHVA